MSPAMINDMALRLALTVMPNPSALPAGVRAAGPYRLQSEAAAARAGAPTAVRTASVTWSRPGVLDHLEPYTWTCEVMGRRADLEAQVTYDAEVLLTWAPLGSDESVLRGWVRDITRSRFGDPADDIWIWRLVLDGPTARAQAVRVGDVPWAAQTSSARLDRLYSLKLPGIEPIGAGSGAIPAQQVAARDVDSAPILDIYRRTAAAQAAFLIEKNGADERPVVSHGVLSGARLQRWNNQVYWQSNGSQVPAVSARVVEDVPRVMTRSGLFTRAELVTRDAEGNDQVQQLAAEGGSSLPASVWRWETDALTGQAPALTAWVQSVIDERCRPMWEYAGPQQLAISELPFSVAARLIRPTTRCTAVWRITGGPSDMPEVMAVTGGSLTLGDDKLLDASVDLVPAATGGLRPAHFDDFAGAQPWMTQTSPAVRWSEFAHTITFDQLALANF